MYVCLSQRNGSDPILCVGICITIDAMINFNGYFDVDANTDVTCEQGNTCHKSNRFRCSTCGEGSHEPLLERFHYNVVNTLMYVCITKL